MSFSQDHPAPPSPKKMYEKPELSIYGDLAQLTGSVGSGSYNDGVFPFGGYTH